MLLPARSQQTRLLTADKHNEYGLAYSLPVTSVRFEITARQTVSTQVRITSTRRNISALTGW